MDTTYDGFYARFTAPSKDEGGILVGADSIVGDVFEVFFDEGDAATACLKNKFGAMVGSFGPDESRRIRLALANGMQVQALLSFVAYSEQPDPGFFWGEAAIVCYHPADQDVFGPFCANIGRKLANGVQPDLNLGGAGLAKLREDPQWIPTGTVPYPRNAGGSAIVKSRQSFTERMVEEGRRGNKGCYVFSVVAILAAIAVVVFLVKGCF